MTLVTIFPDINMTTWTQLQLHGRTDITALQRNRINTTTQAYECDSRTQTHTTTQVEQAQVLKTTTGCKPGL